jgi:hypothetical protein
VVALANEVAVVLIVSLIVNSHHCGSWVDTESSLRIVTAVLITIADDDRGNDCGNDRGRCCMCAYVFFLLIGEKKRKKNKKSMMIYVNTHA